MNLCIHTRGYMLRIFWVALLILSLENAFACKCEQVTIAKNVKLASTILVGKVLNQKAVQTKSQRWAVYTIQVEKVLKGKMTTRIVSVWTSADIANCGAVFANGWRIIIYGYKNDGTLKNELDPDDRFIYTDRCTRSGNYLQSEEKGIRLALG